MSKGIQYKDSYNWVIKILDDASTRDRTHLIKPVFLHSELLKRFPKDKVPTTVRTVARWKKDYKYNPAKYLVETYKLPRTPYFSEQNSVLISIERKLDEITLLLRERNK
tara:strand:+ start:55 stop:381 length:327 start_codon:yes stop_codon:yes gene_type:complete